MRKLCMPRRMHHFLLGDLPYLSNTQKPLTSIKKTDSKFSVIRKSITPEILPAALRQFARDNRDCGAEFPLQTAAELARFCHSVQFFTTGGVTRCQTDSELSFSDERASASRTFMFFRLSSGGSGTGCPFRRASEKASTMSR